MLPQTVRHGIVYIMLLYKDPESYLVTMCKEVHQERMNYIL